MSDEKVIEFPKRPDGLIDLEDEANKGSAGCDSYGFPFANGYYGGQLDFPGTSGDYNGNLRWLICYYRRLIPQIAKMVAAIKELQDLYGTMPDYIRDLVANAMQAVYEQMQLLREEMQRFDEEVDGKIEGMQKKLEGMQVIIASLEVFVNSVLPAAKAYADAKDDELKAWILKYISTIAEQWPPVIDPSDGLMEDINTALKHIYNDAIDGITYNQLNGYGITYGQLNNMHITYRMLNTRMYKLLYRELDSRFYMFSPVNGEWLRWDKVIWQLYRLHFKGTTYEAFDAKGITYDELDAMMRTYQQLNEYGLEDIVG